MTNITLFSDLHLEFEEPEDPIFDPGEGDLLVLDGDICCAESIDKDSTYGERYREFFSRCAARYNKVLYVLGNHEHYGGNIDTSKDRIVKSIDPRISVLENESFVYDGVTYLGATLWTNFRQGNPQVRMALEGAIGDYKKIKIGPKYKRLQSFHILERHDASLKWILDTIYETEGPVVVITHHHPSFESYACGKCKYPQDIFSFGYASELSGEIVRLPQIKMWLCAHMHFSVDYPIDQCRVLANPRGYIGEENPEFDLNFSVPAPKR